MFFMARYEHWSSGSAAAVFDDEAAAKAAFYENGETETMEAPLDTVIEKARQWLRASEARMGFCEQDKEISSCPEDSVQGALWSGKR